MIHDALGWALRVLRCCLSLSLRLRSAGSSGLALTALHLRPYPGLLPGRLIPSLSLGGVCLLILSFPSTHPVSQIAGDLIQLGLRGLALGRFWRIVGHLIPQTLDSSLVLCFLCLF